MKLRQLIAELNAILKDGRVTDETEVRVVVEDCYDVDIKRVDLDGNGHVYIWHKEKS